MRQRGQPESDTHCVDFLEPTRPQYSNTTNDNRKTEHEATITDFRLSEWDEEGEIYGNNSTYTNRIGDDASTYKSNMFSYVHDISTSSSPEFNFSVHTPNVSKYGFSISEYGDNESSYPTKNKNNTTRTLCDRNDVGNSFSSPTGTGRELEDPMDLAKELVTHSRKPASRGNSKCMYKIDKNIYSIPVQPSSNFLLPPSSQINNVTQINMLKCTPKIAITKFETCID